MSISDIVKPDELSQIIACSNALKVYESMINRFSSSNEKAEYLRLKKGIAQELVDEFAPFCIYAYQCHGDSDKLMKYYHDTKQSFDGEILSGKGELLESVEITCAVDGHNESVRMERLNKKGMVNAFGKVKYSGKKGNREFTEEEVRTVSNSQIEAHYVELINHAYLKKKNKTGKYDGMILLIAIEGYLVKELNMDKIVSKLSLNIDKFGSIFLININSRDIRKLTD